MKKNILITTLLLQLTQTLMIHPVYGQKDSQQNDSKSQDMLLVEKYKALESRFGEAVALSLYNKLIDQVKLRKDTVEYLKKKYKMQPIAYFKAGMDMALNKGDAIAIPSLAGDAVVQMLFYALTGERSYFSHMSYFTSQVDNPRSFDSGHLEDISLPLNEGNKLAASLNIAGNLAPLILYSLYIKVEGSMVSTSSITGLGLGSSVSSAYSVRMDDNKKFSEERHEAQTNEFKRFNDYTRTETLAASLAILMPDARDVHQRIFISRVSPSAEDCLVSLFYDRPDILLRLGVTVGFIKSMEKSLRENLGENVIRVPAVSEMRMRVEAMQKLLISEVANRTERESLNNDLEKFKMLLK